MTTDSNKWIEAISVLTELTQRGRLKWQVDSPGVKGIVNHAIFASPSVQRPAAYKAQYRDKWFRLRKIDPGQPATVFQALSHRPFILEIVDETGAVLLEVPESTGLPDLYNAIQYQLSGVDSVLESLLGERNKRI